MGTTGADTNLNNLGWYIKNKPSESAQAVGQLTPNGWGLYDMHGNLYEWCLDWYVDDITGYISDPKGPTSGTTRVVRGGSWNRNAKLCRSANRYDASPSKVDANYGGRVALVK